MKNHGPVIQVAIFIVALVVGIPVLQTGVAYASPAIATQHNQKNTTSATTSSQTPTAPSLTYTAACPPVASGFVRCLAMYSTTTVQPIFASPAAKPNLTTGGSITPAAQPTGSAAPYGPTALHNAYNLPTTVGNIQTVAIVDAFDDPNAEIDMTTYRTMFGIAACTTANGCFRKVNQTGGTIPSHT